MRYSVYIQAGRYQHNLIITLEKKIENLSNLRIAIYNKVANIIKDNFEILSYEEAKD